MDRTPSVFCAEESLLEDVYEKLGPNPSSSCLATTILDLQYEGLIPMGKENAHSFLKQYRCFVRGEKWVSLSRHVTPVVSG